MFQGIRAIYNTFLFYGIVLLFPISPGDLAWKLYKNKKGKVAFLKRDLICDTKTLMSLPANENSLDEFTTSFSPFIPLLTLSGNSWKTRRKILSTGLRKMAIQKDIPWNIPLKKGDIYWDFFEILFKIGFQLIFGRKASLFEFREMYPGIVDINRLIKRHHGFPDKEARWKLYQRVIVLLKEENSHFLFCDCLEFKALNELDQVSIIVEDLLTSICIQCTDLVCHLILLYSSFAEFFKKDLDNCINEALRLFPLTDIWTRKASENERAWIASLTQLNRSGWKDSDHFKPDRWLTKDHPELISWGFDSRSCPATKIGYNLSKNIFQKIISNQKIWLEPATNFKHERTFPSGCQVWIGEGEKPSFLKWKYKGGLKSQLKQWLNSRIRLFDQKELW